VVGGRLVEEARNGSVRYFRAGAGLAPAHRALLHLGRNPSLAPILELVRDAPGISRKELAAALGIAGPTATRQVGRLVADGLVEQQRSGRSQCYRLTPECAAAYAIIEAALAARAGATVPGCATA
jgi:DNA-binding MarR family transcriptional regulator